MPGVGQASVGAGGTTHELPSTLYVRTEGSGMPVTQDILTNQIIMNNFPSKKPDEWLLCVARSFGTAMES